MERNAYDIDRFIEQLPIGIVTLCADGSMRSANERAFRLLGMGVEDALAANFVEAMPVVEVRNAVARVVSDGGTAENFFFERGERFVKCSVSRAAGDEEGGAIIVLEDATTFRQMDHIKHEFIQTILHGLRNPLSTLKTSLSILASGKIAGVEEPAKEIIEMSAQEVNRLNALLNDLRNLFFIETGLAARDLEIESFKVDSVLRRAIDDMARGQPSWAGLAARIVRGGDMEHTMRGDFDKVKQILQHLLRNAYIFAPAATPISVYASRSNAFVTIEVRDEGIGIADDRKPLLFTRFFRDDNEITRNVPGNGLGLFIARSLAELMSGSIYCESAPGKGSSFFLSLPAAQG